MQGIYNRHIISPRLAKKAGLDGVVASPSETKDIRRELGGDFLIVTPGVRPEWAASDDQKRIATPKVALDAGADFIVVGRPITEAKDPVVAVQDILGEMKAKGANSTWAAHKLEEYLKNEKIRENIAKTAEKKTREKYSYKKAA